MGRQIESAGLPLLLADSVSRQVIASGVSADSASPSPFGLLVLLSHEAAFGSPTDALSAAAAVQFLISAAEALDDLQDGDPVAGLAEQDAVAGAELIAALLELSHLGMTGTAARGCRPDRVASAAGALSRFALVALGAQHREIHNTADVAGSVAEAESVARGKSGSFGRAACEVGAMLATDDMALITRVGDFGEQWAIFDQLLDDIAAVWPGGRPDRDLANRRMTVPVALAMDASRSSGAECGQSDTSRTLDRLPATESEARHAVFQSGAIHKTWAIAAVRHARAARIAREISATNPQSRLHELLGN